VTEQFVSIFKRRDALTARGKYLARVFGIFSEDIVRIWARDVRAAYEDLGRPTLRNGSEKSGSTLDFTFRSRETGKLYVAEMKCEIEYQDYKFLVLTESRQLDHHSKPAFAALLAAAARKPDLRAYIAKKEVQIDGAILVWGAATPMGRALVTAEKGFAEVLTLADMVSDLQAWRSELYQVLLDNRRTWSNELYDALSSASRADA
jgi:hypothetical protein